ncbi:YeiH family protein [Nocardioides yefusunii]|uniref:YeiH family protein n=1 Tax=Nocardioides yefusunii TaxID=2500546 RepID=A0ABW1QV42_9ACTN|nr:putative sulfate exporter family transporter [Nocardioides yefusunii]
MSTSLLPSTDTPTHSRAARLLDGAHHAGVPFLVAVASWAVCRSIPAASPLVLALLVGAVVVNLPAGSERRVDAWMPSTKFLLWLGVAGLGLGLGLGEIVSIGVFGIAVVVVTVASTFLLTRWIGTRMGVEPEAVQLVASGFSVCGAAAIAAVEGAVRPRSNQLALALALVTLHGTVLMFALPLAGDAFGFSDRTTAIWAGASLHEVAQVAAAASLIGPAAVAVAMSVKLGRVLMLVPVHRAVSRAVSRAVAPDTDQPSRRGAGVPWFLTLFVVAVLVRSTGMLPDAVLSTTAVLTQWCLGAGMFGMGLGIVLRQLWPLPGRVLVLSCIATVCVTAVPVLMLGLHGDW